MRFDIQLVLDWATVFSGELHSPMLCQLQLDRGYHLIYIDMAAQAAGPAGLDVFALLNRAFDTGLPIGTLYVTDAGFFSFAGGDASAPASLLDIFPDAAIPPDVAKRALPSGSSGELTSFWLTLRLDGNALFNSLVEVGINDGTTQVAELSLSAGLSREAAGASLRKASYQADLPPFKLFRLFQFSAVTLQYRFDTRSVYQLSGDVALTLFGEDYVFHGNLTADGNMLQACVASRDPTSAVAEPFNRAMRGITFSGLVFGVHYTFANGVTPGQGWYRIQGSVQYGALALSGQIYLKDTTPLLASVVIDQELSVATVFAQSIHGAGWPADMVDLVFHKGSSIYFMKEDAGPFTPVDFACPADGALQALPAPGPTIDYAPGFHLYARFDITIIKTLALEGNILIATNGISAEIGLVHPIDLFVLQLVGDQPTNGPRFVFSSIGGSSMTFQAGLIFFQENFGINITLTATKSAQDTLALSGKLSSNQTFAVFPSPPSLSFTYSNQDGFQIVDWPQFTQSDTPVDFLQALKDVSAAASSGCGSLSDWIIDKTLLQTTFSLSPSFATTDGVLSLVLKGSYQIASMGSAIATILFPNLVSFPLKPNISLNDLPGAIGEALASAATSLVQGLLDNAAALATVLAVTAGKKAADYAATLVCQGIADAAAAAAADAAATALAAAGGIAAGAAAIAAASAAATKSDSCCFIAGTMVVLADGSSCPIEQILPGQAVLGWNGQPNRVIGTETPQLGRRLLYALNGSRHFVTSEHPFMTGRGWMAIDPAATARENADLAVGRLQLGDRLSRHGQPSVALECINGQVHDARTWLYNLMLDGDHTYYANGYLVHNKDDPPKPGNPGMPTGLACSYSNGNLVLAWSATGNATGYQVTLRGPDGQQVYRSQVDYRTTSVSVPRPASMAPGAYAWNVAALKRDYTSAAGAVSQVCLAAPVLQTSLGPISDAAASVVLEWSVSAGAAIYLPSMTSAATPPAVPAPARNAAFDLGAAAPGDYAFAVAAANPAGGDIPSDPCPPQTWTRLAPPANVQASYIDGAIEVRWQALAATRRYLLSLYGPDQQLIVRVTDTAGLGQATLPLPVPVTAGSYQACVNSLPDGQAGTRQVPSARAAAPTVVVHLSPAQVAKQAWLAHQDATACAALLLHAFPGLDANATAVAMAAAGYAAADTAAGLRSAYPALSASALAAALLAAYGQALTLDQLAAQAFHELRSGAECGALLIAHYPGSSDLALGTAMKQAGYPAAATGAGLHAAIPAITASRLMALLMQLYG